MEITLYEQKVYIQDNFLAEVSIYNRFIQYSAEARKSYHTFYYNSANINEIIAKSRGVVYEQYRIVAQKIMDALNTNGIYGFTENDILNRHGLYAFEEELKKISNNASNIDIQRNNERAYRNYRKASRGRFVGGGFGIEGAIKGMAMASAANAATGMLHSVVNAFGNIGSSVKHNIAMDNLYHSGVCGDVIKAIDKDIMGFYYVLEQIFFDHGYAKGNIHERIREADNLYAQLESGNIPSVAQKDAVIRMITTFPGKIEYYALAVNLLGGSNGELKKLVEKFGLDTEYYMAIEASSEWRNLVFGDLKSKITKEGYFSYLTKLLYSNLGYGVIPQLEYGPVGVVSVLVSEFIQKFLDDANTEELEFYTFENCSNGFLLALLESRNLKLSLNEVPILCVNISVQIAKNAKTAEYLLLTSDKLYFISKDGHINKVSIQNINKIMFLDSYDLGTQVNDTYFAPKVNFYDKCDYEFLCLINSIVALIQCLQSIGHTNRSAAIIDKDSLSNDYDVANDISVYFKTPIEDLMQKYGSIHNIVIDMNGAYKNKSDSMLQRIDSLQKQLSAVTDEEQRYEIKKEINQLSKLIQDSGTDKNLELIEKDETIIGIQSSSEVKMILTNKNLYLHFPPKTGKAKICIELSQIKSAYYEWAFISEAFWINGIEYKITSTDKNTCKTFMGLIYWSLRYKKEWEWHLSNDDEKSTNQNSIEEHKISFEQATKEFKDVFSSYKNLLLEGKLESIWSIAEKGDALAEYILEQFYKDTVLQYAIKKHDMFELKSLLNVISTYATAKHPFGIYLAQYLTKSIYLANNQEGQYSYNIRECNRIIDQIEGECMSLCANRGFEILESKVVEKEDALLMLKKAAENYHPVAMAWYGSYLYEGLHRVRKNEALGRFYIELAVYAGQGYAIKLNEKYGFGFKLHKESLKPCINNFKITNGHLCMKSFPQYLSAKCISRFMAQSKDVLFDINGLQPSAQLTMTKDSLQIATDETVFLAISACFLGHFKKNMNGLAITSKGIHINGGMICGGVGFIDWDNLQEKSIFVKDGLRIDNLSLICASFDELLKDLLIDLRGIAKIILQSSEYKSQLTEFDNKQVEKTEPISISAVNKSNESNTNCELKDVVICSSCKKENPNGKKFCKYCGAKLTNEETISAVKICPNCGNEIKPGKAFCGKCGSKI